MLITIILSNWTFKFFVQKIRILKNQCTLLSCLFLSDQNREKVRKQALSSISVWIGIIQTVFGCCFLHRINTHTYIYIQHVLMYYAKIELKWREEKKITRIILLYYMLGFFSVAARYIFFLVCYTFSCCSSSSFHKKSTHAQRNMQTLTNIESNIIIYKQGIANWL